MRARLGAWLHRQLQGTAALVDARGLAGVRILVGLVLVWECLRYADGKLDAYFIAPKVHFGYWGFGWVQPWGELGMKAHLLAMGAAATGFTLGLFYRLSAATWTLLFAYLFLAEKSRYLNHHYLVILLSMLFTCLPAHRAWSVDRLLARALGPDPDPPPARIPQGAYTMLRLQLGLVYFYAAVAKLTPDWLAGLPVRNMLSHSLDLPVVGPWLGEPAVILFVAYSGLLIDLLAFPLLMWSRTRWLMVAALTAFHLSNAQLFGIGIFPWMMLALTPIFFSPGWPLLMGNWLVKNAGALLGWRRLWWLGATAPGPAPGPLGSEAATRWRLPGPRRAALAAGLWLLVQAVLPMRHWLVPGNPEWHEVGHRWAWRMKLRSRRAAIRFRVLDLETFETWEVSQRRHMPPFQRRKVCKDPDLAWQFARWLAARHAESGRPRIDVRAIAFCSLNRRRPQLLIDPMVNLVTAPRGGAFDVPAWIKPLKQPPPALMDPDPPRAWAYTRAYPTGHLFRDAIEAELTARGRR